MRNIKLIGNIALCICVLSLFSNGLLAQDSLKKEDRFTSNFYMDAYYSYDFGRPQNHQKASFLYNHNRHNEGTINLALAALSYKDAVKRANLGLMAGTYPQYNLAGEPELLRHLYEASVGIRLSKKKEVWLDAGIFPSHIGFESAISKNCWTLTRSMLAENSPYYEAGIKASYQAGNQKWYMAALLLNGWQRIKRVDGNNTPAFGTQLTYHPTKKLSLNGSTFIGNDQPDSLRRWRYFHNLYAIGELSQHWGITIGLDIGFEQKQKHSAEFNKWFSPVLIVRYQKEKWAVAGRAEYYNDPNGVIVPLVNAAPFRMQGYSINIDRSLGKNGLWRVEGRGFRNPTGYFNQQGRLSRKNFFITMAFAISIE